MKIPVTIFYFKEYIFGGRSGKHHFIYGKQWLKGQPEKPNRSSPVSSPMEPSSISRMVRGGSIYACRTALQVCDVRSFPDLEIG